MRSVSRLLTVVLLAAAPAAAQEIDVGGSLTGELRGFFGGPLFPDQLSSLQPSLTIEPYFRIRSDSGTHQLTIEPFLRLDGKDPQRSRFDLREAYWHGVFGDTEVVVGADRVFWGVTESRHLVDIVNQTDAAEDIDGESKLGQPMFRVEWQRPWGRLSGMALVGFRERLYAGSEGRLRFPLPVDDENALFPDGERAVDLALRYSHFFGDFDLGLGAFHGTSREPSFRVNPDGTELIPVYSEITQLGLDLQYTRDAWLWKLEGLVREGHGQTFGAAVLGFEYTMYQVFGSAADVGLLAEYLYDGRDETAPPTAFAQGAFVGARVALNDVDDTTLLVGAIVDLEDGTIAGRVEAQRRITSFLSVEIESRFFTNVAERSLLQSVSQDSFTVVRFGLSF